MRLPLIRPSDLKPTQKELYDHMRVAIAQRFDAFETADEDGALIGPFNASLHYPEVGRASWALTEAVTAMGNLSSLVKEVAILVVAGFNRASYEIYAHTAVAVRLGMEPARISALVANVKLSDLPDDEAIAFDVAHALCRGGPLPEPTWQLAVATFGDVAAAQLVYLVGVYAFVSVSLNGFDVPVPG